ncbi:MAG: tRNA (guanosine(37)-N1)-methyltransferase TrmD [Actinomycetia bacterium]|nr:tRNA (guanosine(37)-N1)-methyltransferase TrmD [Actinomycetes bacterium]
MLNINVITIFPDFFANFFEHGVIKEAFLQNLCQVNIYNLRDFTTDKQKKVDDRPYGGGPGMVLMPQPLDEAINYLKDKIGDRNGSSKTILLTPKGRVLNQPLLKELVKIPNLILVCGRYEGIDQRVIDLDIDMEISIGDYVLSGGEVPAMVLMDGLIRLLPGVVGKKESVEQESFEDSLLDFPQYTRPPVFKGLKVPEVLLTGNHEKIKSWRNEQSVKITKNRRPDLFDKKS